MLLRGLCRRFSDWCDSRFYGFFMVLFRRLSLLSYRLGRFFVMLFGGLSFLGYRSFVMLFMVHGSGMFDWSRCRRCISGESYSGQTQNSDSNQS